MTAMTPPPPKPAQSDWRDSPFASPTLKQLVTTNPANVPDPMPLCGHCPMANWYVIHGKPHVLCLAMGKYPWTRGSELTACDAHHKAIAQIKAQSQNT